VEGSVRAFDLFLIEQSQGAVGYDKARQKLYLGDRVNWIDHRGRSVYGQIIGYEVYNGKKMKIKILRERAELIYPYVLTFTNLDNFLKVEKLNV